MQKNILIQPHGSRGDNDGDSLSPQPDTSLHCKNTDMDQMCLFLPAFGFCCYPLHYKGLAKLS